MRRGTPISFLIFSFFPLLIMQHIPAVQRSRDELNWSDPSTRTPSYHPTRGCTVECAVQLGKHTQVSRLPNEHTSVSLSCSTPWYRVTRYKQVHCPLIQGGRSGPATISMCFSTSRTFTHDTRVHVNDWCFTQANQATVTDLIVVLLENPIFKAVLYGYRRGRNRLR